MKKFNWFSKKVFGYLATFVLVFSSFIILAGRAQATPTPQFNHLAGDYELLMLKKQGDTTWTDPISATAGDTVEFLIYYHNGVQDSVAHNTKIKATLPTGTSSTLVTTASIDSDETSPITDTIVNGSVVGRSGGTINVTGSESSLSYVDNTAKWYVQDINDADGDGNKTELIIVPFPSSQPDESIFDSDGVNIGTVNGCWQFAGFLYFKAQLSGGAPGANVHKWVDISGGPTNWRDEITTEPGNYANYLIYYDNVGSATATGVQVIDSLPDKVSFAPGTAIWRVKRNDNDVDIPIPDSDIVFNGRQLTFNFPDPVGPTHDQAFYLRFQILIDGPTSFPVGNTDLTNTARITSTNGVNAPTNPAIIHVNRAPDATINFLVDKRVDNSSIGGTDDPWLDHTTASPGDTLTYKIDIINQGNTDAPNVLVTDTLPSWVTYQAGTTKLYYIGNDAGTTMPDSLTTTGLTISPIPAGNQQMRILTFQVRVNLNPPTGTTTLVNTAIVPANSSNTPPWVLAQDTATVDVSTSRSLTIAKTVKNPSGNWVESVRHEEGDVVNFRIRVVNNGNSTLTEVWARDVLPQYLEYIIGSTYIDGIQQASDTLVTTGLHLTNLNPGGGKTITFQARVLDCPPLGDQTLVNTGYALAQDVTEINDTAQVQVLVEPPTPPTI